MLIERDKMFQQFLDFFANHWFLGLMMLWIGLMVVSIVFRTIRICVRGWPPEHLDVSGDQKTSNDRKSLS